jgi:taurine dioxygenase
MQYKTIEVRRLGPVIGAEISGLDLRRPLNDRAAEELKAALFENQVLFFRDQDITPDQHRTLSQILGDAVTHPFFNTLSDDYPDISLIETGGADTPLEPGTSFAYWHTDMTFFENPPLAAILRAKKLPPMGSDTL